jgi:hypothetical protein
MNNNQIREATYVQELMPHARFSFSSKLMLIP